MKTTFRTLAIMLLGIVVATSCKKLDTNFDAKYVVNLDVVVPPGGLLKAGVLDKAFTASKTIDPLSDADMAKYANQIKDVQVNSVTGVITSITKPVTLVNSTLTVTSPGYNTATWAITNQLLEVGKTITLNDDNGQFTDIHLMLKDMKTVTVTLAGTSSDADVEFTFELTLDTKVTASPL